MKNIYTLHSQGRYPDYLHEEEIKIADVASIARQANSIAYGHHCDFDEVAILKYEVGDDESIDNIHDTDENTGWPLHEPEVLAENILFTGYNCDDGVKKVFIKDGIVLDEDTEDVDVEAEEKWILSPYEEGSILFDSPEEALCWATEQDYSGEIRDVCKMLKEDKNSDKKY